MTAACVACGSGDVALTVRRASLPIMQNVVFASADEAKNADRGEFELGVCHQCGFAFNARFDAARMVYDERYDNDVPSRVFEQYYREIARHLAQRHGLAGGVITDIGCGKGRFLELFCEEVPGVHGVGVDPSCQPREATASSPVTLERDFFRAKHVTVPPQLVVCRHVLEHIAKPVEFLKVIHQALEGAKDVPLFFEVPDLEWVLRNGAFWDFCYEHCNYFTRDSLAHALSLAGFAVDDVVPGFGGQYLWAHARRLETPRPTTTNASSAVADVLVYADREQALLVDSRRRAHDASIAGTAVVWGMATKGVIFSTLVDPERSVFSMGIDINPKKQNRFAPVTGLEIRAPEALLELGSRKTSIFVMNGNYLAEIRARCSELAIDAEFVLV